MILHFTLSPASVNKTGYFEIDSMILKKFYWKKSCTAIFNAAIGDTSNLLRFAFLPAFNISIVHKKCEMKCLCKILSVSNNEFKVFLWNKYTSFPIKMCQMLTAIIRYFELHIVFKTTASVISFLLIYYCLLIEIKTNCLFGTSSGSCTSQQKTRRSWDEAKYSVITIQIDSIIRIKIFPYRTELEITSNWKSASSCFWGIFAGLLFK